jgi:glutamate carboxypeptidase
MANPDLRAHAAEARDAYLSLLESLVTIETPSGDLEGAERFVAHLAGVLAGDGWDLRLEAAEGAPGRGPVGDLVEARLAGGTGPRTLLLAHYDTVHPVGTLQRSPWLVEGDVARGPGVLDMKAGIAAALVAPRLLRAAGLGLHGSVALLVTSDEETGSHGSRSRIEALAREADRVVVLEPSRDDGALKIARKGVADYHLSFAGRAAHAGLAPETGANALLEMAHAALAIAALADPPQGTTVSPTVGRAGSATNVIPDEARLSVDVRLPTLAEADRVDAALRGYAPRIQGVQVHVAGGVNRPPMEANEGNTRLFEEARTHAASWGWTLEGALVGGGSDGNFTSALGVPTLDGVGALGGGAHTLDEWLRVGATLDRVALVTALLAEP